jgi:hypothetical protein
MPAFEELDTLSSKELHDRAVKLAEHRLDVKFFWDLLKEIPAAEAVAGDLAESEFDVTSGLQRVNDAMHADDGRLADALRPIYIGYLLKHEKD